MYSVGARSAATVESLFVPAGLKNKSIVGLMSKQKLVYLTSKPHTGLFRCLIKLITGQQVLLKLTGYRHSVCVYVCVCGYFQTVCL